MELSFKYWAEKWLEAEKSEVKPSTLNEYQKVVGQLIDQFVGLDMTEITPKRVQGLLDKLFSQGKAKSTINKRKYNIQQIFRFANVNGLELANPCSFARTPRKATRKQRRALTLEEMALVVLERNKSKYGFYAFMLLYTGLRRSELLALAWEDIDFINNVIHVNKVVSYVNKDAIIDDVLKNGDAEKLIPIPEILKSELKKVCDGEHGLIFGRSCDIPANPNAHSWRWEKYKRHIGLEATQHMFRHTYCTMLFDAGVDVKTAAYLMGHRDTHNACHIHAFRERTSHQKGYRQTQQVHKLSRRIIRYIFC